VLKNTDERGDKDNGAQHAKENKRQPFFTHAAKYKVGAFGGKAEQ